jgi:hypothetical protein
MIAVKDKGGRPFLTEKQKSERKELILVKLEPYLKSGLSINKSLSEAKVHNSEFYKYMKEDRLFGEKIAKFRQYISVLLNQVIVNELLRIVQKQAGSTEKQIPPQSLDKNDIEFLWWYALNANVCKDEWGNRKQIINFDPEMELQKVKLLINEAAD